MKTLIFVLAMTVVPLPAAAQIDLGSLVCDVFGCDEEQEAGSSSQPSVSPGEVYIFNSTQRSLVIGLRPADGGWASFTLQPNTGYNYTRAHVVRINTEGRSVEYSMEEKQRYYLAWNEEKRLWDIFRMSPR